MKTISPGVVEIAGTIDGGCVSTPELGVLNVVVRREHVGTLPIGTRVVIQGRVPRKKGGRR